jgi:hypothetical protein
MDRIEQLRRGLTKSMKGLEIGPFFNPIVPRREGWQTTIIDYTDKAGLLRRVADLNQPDVTALSSQIDDVDIVWRGEPLDELCLKRKPDGYDFLVASHVIEHIPDLIRFLQSLALILKAPGVLSLAVPDLRYCFDFYKPWTNTAKVLAAYRARRKIHSAETVFETDSCDALVNTRGAWLREPFIIPEISRDVFAAYDNYLAYVQSEEAGAQPYRDVHCWQFTPSTFELVMLELNCLRLIAFDVDWIEENAGSEFVVQLKKKTNVLSVQEVHDKRIKLYRKAMGELTNRCPY